MSRDTLSNPIPPSCDIWWNFTEPPQECHVLFEWALKLRCDERFTHAFTACSCVFKEITLVVSNQGNYFEYENACSKRTLKTTVATQL